MTLRCASCGRLLRRYAMHVLTSRGMEGYGPKCAREAGLQALVLAHQEARSAGIHPDEIARIRSLVRANGWDGKRISRARAPRTAAPQRQRDDRQLQLELV